MKSAIWTYCTGIVKACHWWVVAALLTLFFGLGITAMSHESAIVDEVAHISAGYSYLKYHDYRLNPEHPPLMKVLAAVPLQFMHLQFPINQPGWTTEPNGEWDVGYAFLYHLGNSADAILFWSRLPILLVAVGFGFFFYWYNRRYFGLAIGLLAVFFYALSPDILANSTLVTTDLGAAAFIFMALAAFAEFLRKPDRKHMFILGLALTGAQLAKFSGVLLYPLLAFIVIVWAIVQYHGKHDERWRRTVFAFFWACLLSFLLIYLAYLPETWNLPLAVQQQEISYSIPQQPWLINILRSLAALPGGQIPAQYLLGVTMATGRVAGGNVTYFVGQVRNGSFLGYFPLLFLVKTQVSFLILGFASLIAGLAVAWRKRRRLTWWAVASWCSKYTLEVVLVLFVAAYLATAMSGNLDLGLRHILPIYPPLFVLVAMGTVWLFKLIKKRPWRLAAGWVLAGLLAWYGIAMVTAYPNYLSYFNELIGGPGNADKYFSDSSVDWGQSFILLQEYLAAHPQIKTVALDYFGGAYPQYYLCARNHAADGQIITDPDTAYDCSHSNIIYWHASNPPYTGQYIAVSETYLENDRYYSEQTGAEGYTYLRDKTPIAKIGNSIYLYKMY